MSKVILLCGKICSGKSTYADKLRRNSNAIVLSVDEIMLALFGQDAGEQHDGYVAALEQYLFAKSAEVVQSGTDVIMDIGLWTRTKRIQARVFYNRRDIPCEIHYLDLPDDERMQRIAERNRAITEQSVSAYYVDSGLSEKSDNLFEIPEKAEIDVYISG